MIPSWLLADVPLYAFLLALLTDPTTWAKQARKIVKKRFGQKTTKANTGDNQ